MTKKKTETPMKAATAATPDYSKPMEVTDAQIAFPASLGELLPDYDTYVKDWEATPEAEPFLAFANTWFSKGLAGNSEIHLKEGIDGTLMFRHLRVLMGSFEPKHEHKIGGVAWLLSQWADRVLAVSPQERV